ncbi:hypothetical protein HYG87_05245 [Methanobacterium alkalithermotolerans]|uniref:Uncharacterized protein n=1 Tax=Methanobacterium alkalithermotolerans TaxID=2731220 RepID=A0A8T8K3V5_9EURY|nr:hypothetical protein [Methanobacterium alkalithermotolerans]QUH23216.1 hypothetical protein HYG87_05245 [Methanobacterium alkalithermotolerans]RJS49212.1 MAG: hypothetical protein CIT03_04340 [Methanobacterium sp.]
MERINISQNDKILKILRDLEKDLEAGNISKKEYQSQKREYSQQLETLEAADRIKMMRGQKNAEKSLDHWAEKNKAEKDQIEEEELVKKYVTTPKTSGTHQNNSQSSKSKIGALAAVFLALAFFIGSGFGVYILDLPTTATDGTVLVNDTAFPTFENSANITQNTQVTTVTQSPTEDTPSNGGDSPGNGDSPGDGGNTGGGGTPPETPAP